MTTKQKTTLSILITYCLMMAFYAGYKLAQNKYSFSKPYSISIEELSHDDIERCRENKNCKQIMTEKEFYDYYTNATQDCDSDADCCAKHPGMCVKESPYEPIDAETVTAGEL